MDAIQKNIVDNYMMPIAEREFNKATEEWEARLESEKSLNAERLKNPQFATSLGLPPDLPQHTIDILKVTLAIDSIGPQKPERDKVYRRYGF